MKNASGITRRVIECEMGKLRPPVITYLPLTGSTTGAGATGSVGTCCCCCCWQDTKAAAVRARIAIFFIIILLVLMLFDAPYQTRLAWQAKHTIAAFAHKSSLKFQIPHQIESLEHKTCAYPRGIVEYCCNDHQDQQREALSVPLRRPSQLPRERERDCRRREA